MGERILTRRALPALLLLAAACAAPPPAPPKAPARAVDAACSNALYAFTCRPPAGFIVTQQGPGPGTVLTLARRALAAADEAPGLRLRVVPMKGQPFAAFVESKVVDALRRAPGATDLEVRPARIGGFDGREVRVLRSYESGKVAWRIFAFRRGADAFLLEFTVPETSRVEPGTDPLGDFLGSLRFHQGSH